MTILNEAPAAGGGSAASARIEWAPVPKVNLLPPEILQARRLSRVKQLLGGAVGAVVLLCVGATVWAQAGASAAQDQLDGVRARGAALRAEQERYAAVPKLLNLIQSAGAARERAMSQDVLWYAFLSDLSVTTPKGITLNGLQVSLNQGPIGSGSLAPSGFATVTFTGSARQATDVAEWLDAVARIHGVDGSTLQSVTREDTTGGEDSALSFTTAATVTSKALTHRYDRKAD
jgi:hypothetical protein